MKRFLACLLLFLLSIMLFAKSVNAASKYGFHEATEGQINEALNKTVPVRFLRPSPFYFLVTLKENISRFFEPSSAKKAEFDMIVSGKKLRETYLLTQKGDINDAALTLISYSKRLDSMTSQLQKARSQNQDVVSLVDEIAENLRVQETLLFAVEKKWQEANVTDISVLADLGMSAQSHVKAVLEIDSIKPGVKDRFGDTANVESVPVVSPSPTPFGGVSIESSSSTVPRKIIY